MNVSIIIPLHNPNKEILEKALDSLKKQEFKDKKEIILVDKGWGLAKSMNYGIKKAKYDVIVTLHQDCVPSSNYWLSNLIKPLLNKETVATASKVELPKEFWEKFGVFARVMSVKEQKLLTPLLDEKGCAYKKSALIQVGLFDSHKFKTAGEDFDMAIKLLKIGKIEYPDSKVYHYHKHTFKNRIKKELQLSNAFGVLVRTYKSKMPNWHRGVLKAIPIIGWLILICIYPYKRMKSLGILWFFLSFIVSLIYSYGFWKGFLINLETI
jgi:GT2 family glycosyltransferase